MKFVRASVVTVVEKMWQKRKRYGKGTMEIDKQTGREAAEIDLCCFLLQERLQSFKHNIMARTISRNIRPYTPRHFSFVLCAFSVGAISLIQASHNR